MKIITYMYLYLLQLRQIKLLMKTLKVKIEFVTNPRNAEQ